MMPEAEELEKQEAELAALNEELRLDLAQAAIDVAGIADPTPISDVTGAALSLYRGDLIGAGLSLISVIPYAGDALVKTAKGARLAKKISSIKKKIEATTGRIAKLKKRGKKVDAELPASARAKDAKSKGDDAARGSKSLECGKPGIWSSNKDRSSLENVYGHWQKHKAEFPEFLNAKQYADGAKTFMHNSPTGTLVKQRRNGDILKYHPESNTFGVMDSSGVPKTMFRPSDGIDYWSLQK